MQFFKNYRGLFLLLLATFGIMWAYSAYGPVDLGGFSPKPSKLHAAIVPEKPKPTPQKKASAKSAAPTAKATPKFPVPVDSASKVILFIGDSMLEGLGPRMAAYAQENGHTLYTVIWYSSQSQAWGQTHRATEYIKKLKPSFIFLSLGGNELFVKDIKEKREKYVQSIVREFGDIPYVWIGPPNWKPDTGINALIRDNVPQGCYFKSDGMHFERSKDGAHPTHASAALWMDSIARWMPLHGAHPIKMNKPKVAKARPARQFMHQPSEIP